MVETCFIGDDWVMEGRKEFGFGMWEVFGWLILFFCIMVLGLIFIDYGIWVVILI